MQFFYTGNNPRFLEQSFFDGNGDLSIDVTSVSPTEVVLTHIAFAQADVVVTLRGLGFSSNPNEPFPTGLITSIEFDGLGIDQGLIDDIAWDARDFFDGLIAVSASQDFSGVAALINASGPLTLDVSGGRTGFDQELVWSNLNPLITQPITFIGSPFDDSFSGTDANDVVDTRNSDDQGDRIVASLGDDRIIFDLPDDNNGPGFYLDYDSITSGVDFVIDGINNTGSATAADFVDTYENVSDALGDYLGIEGTTNADSYDIRLGPDQVFAVVGGRGADSYNLDVDGAFPIIDFFFGGVSSGIVVDLATGSIANDGFGFSETLDVQGTPTRLIVFSTNLDDVVSDGPGDQLIRFYDGNDSFFADNLGDDSIDGGNGTDTVVFRDVAQGNMTISFEGSLATISDRTNTTGSTTVLSVETVESAGGVELNLAQHVGFGNISAEDLTDLTELYIAYFNRAADALGLSFWATAFQNGFSLREIADLFFTQPETQSLYAGVSDGAFVRAVYNNVLGRDPDDPGFDFWTGQLAAGNITESSFILELLAGARAATGDPADVAFITDKTDIGLYFAAVQGQSDVDDARNVMDLYDGTIASFFEATDAAEASYAAALASDTELLLPVVGVIDALDLGIV